jgi:TrpR-related protein YerC/YecD
MKTRQPRDPEVETSAESRLYEAVMQLESADEAADFFRDLCTPAELQAIADRWLVVALLREGRAYRDIHDRTGVSVTTIGRVARFLEQGNGGYKRVADRLRLGEGKDARQDNS